MDLGYLPVRLSTLKPSIQLGFNLYLQLPHKTIKYIASVDDIEIIQIENLKLKKVRKLFIDDTEENKYQEYIDRCLNATMSDDSLSTDKKAEVVVGASEASAERIMTDPHSQKSYDSAQNTAGQLINVLSQNDEILKGIFDHKLDEESDNQEARMHKHAVNVSSLCISFGEFLKLPKETIEQLGIAGLFHDVAFGQVEQNVKDLFFKPIESTSSEELIAYKEHPKLGGEILQDKEFASKEVINFILTHEERQGGNGFPNKISKLDLAQEALALSCFYDQQVTCFNLDRKEVLKELAISQLGNFELTTINKFKEFIIKVGLKS